MCYARDIHEPYHLTVLLKKHIEVYNTTAENMSSVEELTYKDLYSPLCDSTTVKNINRKEK